MSFSKQLVFCNCCGEEFYTNFLEWDGRVCSKDCWDKLNLIRTYSTIGQVYVGKENVE